MDEHGIAKGEKAIFFLYGNLICSHGSVSYTHLHTALSLELVKPATCASVAVGAVLSGLVLANGIAQKRLLCGVSVGVFYALCLSLTTALSGKPLVFDHVNLALLAALLFGGTAGGVLSALGAVGNTAPER